MLDPNWFFWNVGIFPKQNLIPAVGITSHIDKMAGKLNRNVSFIGYTSACLGNILILWVLSL